MSRLHRVRSGPSGRSAGQKPAVDVKPIEEVFAGHLKYEHDLIGHRMSWLMTLNGFLIGGTAILLANRDKFSEGDEPLFIAAVITIGALGVVCNVSSLYSNRWASTAIHEAGRALEPVWKDRGFTPEQITAKKDAMRLYGRDPKSLDKARPPRSEMLHPWMLIPGVFTVVYAAMPFLTSGMVANGVWAWLVLRLIPSGLALAVLISGWLMDRVSDS